MTRDEYRKAMRALMREATAIDDARLRKTIAMYRDEPQRFGVHAARSLEAWAIGNEHGANEAGMPPDIRTYLHQSATIHSKAAALIRAYLGAPKEAT
jgi:hypothetical protein